MKNIFFSLIIIFSISSFAQDGRLDPTFNPTANLNDEVRAIAVQADGKILIGGWFTENGNYSIIRLNRDGSTDTGFNHPSGLISGINDIVVQPDQKILVGGGYPGFLKRLNADGSLDPTFDARLEPDGVIWAIKVMEDKSIIVSGLFGKINSTPIQSLAKLSSLGEVDSTFDFNLPLDIFVDDFEFQSDGKLILTGVYDPDPDPQMLVFSRYNPDGSLDGSFAAAQQTSGNYIYDIEIDQDDRILVSGPFTKIGGTTRYNLARLDKDGSLDSTFDSYNFPQNGTTYTIFGVKALDDGKYFINGSFNIYDGHNSFSIAKLNNNGTFDTSFDIGSGPNGYVDATYIQEDGKILIGGEFTAFDGTSINRIARLGNTLSINDYTFGKDIRVYPNPFKEVLNFEGFANESITISIYSLTGQLIKSQTLSHLRSVDTESMTKGMYIARISNGENFRAFKIIKE